MLTFLIIISLVSSSFAQESVPLVKGQSAPFDGVLLSKPKAEEVRVGLIERDQFKVFNEALQSNIKIQKTIIDNQKGQVDSLLKQNQKLVKQFDRANSVSNFERTMWFGLGIVATGLAVYGAGQIGK